MNAFSLLIPLVFIGFALAKMTPEGWPVWILPVYVIGMCCVAIGPIFFWELQQIKKEVRNRNALAGCRAALVSEGTKLLGYLIITDRGAEWYPDLEMRKITISRKLSKSPLLILTGGKDSSVTSSLQKFVFYRKSVKVCAPEGVYEFTIMVGSFKKVFDAFLAAGFTTTQPHN